MKTIPAGLQAAYDAPAARLAHRWQITRSDGQVFRFTDLDRDITIDGVTWLSTASFSASTIKTTGDFAVDNLEVRAVIDADGITEADVELGLWDRARIDFYRFDFSDPAAGVEYLRRGEIGQVRISDGQLVIELRGLVQRLQTATGRVVSPLCNADLGDARCGVDLSGSTATGTVTSVVSRQRFVDTALPQVADFFRYGRVTWLTGDNAGAQAEVLAHASGGDFTLYLPMGAPIQVGDTFTVTRGCRKTLEACRDDFDNVINFRGFPHVPGNDQLLGG